MMHTKALGQYFAKDLDKSAITVPLVNRASPLVIPVSAKLHTLKTTKTTY